MSKLISKYLVFFIAAIISLTTSLPHVYGYLNYGRQYTPFNLYEGNQYQRDEIYAYAAQVQQVLKGHFVGDAYIWEHKNSSSPFLSEFISILPLAILSLLLGSVELAFITSDFIFPATLFLLIYLFLKEDHNKVFSQVAAAAVVLLPFFSTLIPFVYKDGYLWTGTSQDPLFITRTPHPQISLIFLSLAVFITSKSLIKNKSKSLVPLAIIAGLSLYTSVFISSTVILALIILAPLLMKNANKKGKALSFLVFILVVLPWALNFLGYQQMLKETDFFIRASYPKEILFPRQLRYIFFAIVLFLLSKSPISKTLIAFALSAGILMDLHQVFLGRSIDADHWISRVIAPLVTLAIFLAFPSIIKNSKRLGIISLIALIFIILIGFFSQVRWINKNKTFLTPDLRKADIFKKIITSTKNDDVIAATTLDLNQFIPGATGRYIYIGSPERSLLDSDEHLERICDVFQIAKEKNLSSSPDQLLELEIYFQKWKLNKEVNKDKFIKECIGREKNYYKIDYLVDKKPDGKYKLVKY